MARASSAPRSDLRHTVASLAGQSIRRVLYYGLRYETEDPVVWDLDGWHHAEMGVELELDDGSRYSMLWGDAFGNFNIDAAAMPMAAWFPHISDLAEHFRVWDATAATRWALLVSDPVVDAHLIWAEGSGEDVPVAVRLSFLHGDVWIAAAYVLDAGVGDLAAGGDEVVVIFDEDLARTVGVADSIPRRDQWLAYRTSCPQCGHRLEAVYAKIEGETYLECPDCGLGFSGPQAVEQPVDPVFRVRELRGGKRPATRDDINSAGWDLADFA